MTMEKAKIRLFFPSIMGKLMGHTVFSQLKWQPLLEKENSEFETVDTITRNHFNIFQKTTWWIKKNYGDFLSVA